MKAIGYHKSLPVTDPMCLEDIEQPMPQPGPRDLRVRVAAVSVNPVDTKVRMRSEPKDGYAVLGFDAAGTVDAIGDAVTDFKVGDPVYYAGDVTRPGTNAEYHLVDERIVGHKPASLTMAEAAALPLTAITAWELLFDCFALDEGGGDGETLLVIGGAGGVGSILIQLARSMTRMQIVATASRDETRDWCLGMGAHQVIDHGRSIAREVADLGIEPAYVASLTASDRHYDDVIDLIRPRGHIGMIDDPGKLDITRMKQKALNFHWEFMFSRPMFQTADMAVQGSLLNRVAEHLDAGRLRTTAVRDLGVMSAATLLEAHRLQESGQAIGKTVLHGFA